jgi:4-hydroxyacetophenone monooxygenase
LPPLPTKVPEAIYFKEITRMNGGLVENLVLPSDSEDLATMCRRALKDEIVLRKMLAEADVVPQAILCAQLTGDESILHKAGPFIDGGWSHMERIPADLRGEIREALIAALKAAAAGRSSGAALTEDKLTRLLSYGVNQLVPDDYGRMFMEEAAPWLGKIRTADWRRRPSADVLADFPVLIAGAGASGLCMAVMLKKAGVPFKIVERNDEVGGTWYENQYPGAGVDIPNHVYSFSFEPKPDWTRVFGLRNELFAYLKDLASKYDLRQHIIFNSEVSEAVYDSAHARWRVTIRNKAGDVEVLAPKIFVPSVGSLNRPAMPKVPGLDSFKGPMFHTARWDHSVNVAGKRVAIVGTGASSVQVGPTIAPDVARLMIFQRSPGWVGLNQSYHTVFSPGMQWANANVPYFYMWVRFLLFWASGDVNHALVQRDPAWDRPHLSLNARSHAVRENMIRYMESELADRPDLLVKVAPNYPPWGKRMLRDNGWFKMLMRDNVELINSGVVRIEPDAIVDADGKRHPVDIIIMATGFKPNEVLAPMHIVGRSGRAINDIWKAEGARAYIGMTVPDFPNMFILGGPNTGLSHGGGIFFYIELQVRYIMQCLREMIERNKSTMEVREVLHDEYNRRVDEMHARMVWTHSDVSNWYRNEQGRVVGLSPWRIVDFWKLTLAMNPDDFVMDDA